MLLRNDAGAGRQRLIQPVQADFFDFNPAIAHGLETALFEGLAVAIAVEQGEAAMQWAWREQRDQMAHGEVPCG
ncbi:Transcriptional regulator [Pseudomonas sp. IT-196MI5]